MGFMEERQRAGRPKASSREVLAEAACELFLERGYEATSVADITSRVGVSRSSFFNYFSSKGDVLWSGFDARLTVLETALRDDESADAEASIRAHIAALAVGFAPDNLALAIVNTVAMGIEVELARESAVRRARIANAVAARLQEASAPRIRARIRGAAYAGAVWASVEQWALQGPLRVGLGPLLRVALDEVAVMRTDGGAPAAVAGSVRQLRVVVRASEFDAALSFYRDVVGMPELEAYGGEGRARVAILDAGRATLELSNTQQVEYIDRVETEGGVSDRIRIGLQVDDAAAAATRLASAGAEVEASARQTPWRSINARLRGPAGLQLTLFQELGPE